MMNRKRIFITAGTVAIIGIIILCIFVRSQSLSAKSPDRAVETIENLLGKSVEVKDDNVMIKKEAVKQWATGSMDDLYTLWEVDEKVNTKINILFLYDNDKKVLLATHSDKSFASETKNIDKSYKEDKYHNSQNYSKGAFAWENDGYSRAILTDKQGYNCSSIWAYNTVTNSISLVWYDNQADAWKDYNS